MDFDDDFSWGWRFGDMIGNVIWGLFSFFVFLVIVGLIFLLVRYLLVATRAAQVYLQLNEPARPAAAATATPTTTTAAPTATTPTATAPTTPAPAATTKPAPRTRTPKTPPTT